MSKLQTELPTDDRVVATWDEYIQAIENPIYAKAKGYYYRGKLRIEMASAGCDHASDHIFIVFTVNLFCSLKSPPVQGLTNCSYRKAGYQEAQPDVSYYTNANVDAVPWGTSIINLDNYPPPNLVIEIANTSLADDKGEKRLLYEELKVGEYWIVDVQNVQVIAFAVADGGSKRITESQVLPGLAISPLEDALRRTRQMNQTQVGAWLLAQFQQ